MSCWRCGAVVRDLPLHALATREDAPEWTLQQAQHWDCYGLQFALLAYPYLSGLEARARCAKGEERGDYLFTACPLNDGYSAEPAQSKEFMFLSLHNGRFTAQPTNRVLFEERSFTVKTPDWPTDIKRQEEVWASETGETPPRPTEHLCSGDAQQPEMGEVRTGIGPRRQRGRSV